VNTLTFQTRRLCFDVRIFPRFFCHKTGLVAWILWACFSVQAADWTSLRGGDGQAAAAVAKSGADLNAWDAEGNG